MGKTFRDPTASLFITPTAKGGTAPDEWLDVKVEFSAPGNHEPTATLTPPAGPVRAREPVTFTAAASDPDGDALTYAWDFGEGKTAAGPAVTWTFEAGGPREVRLRVTDGKGGLAEAVWAVAVEDPLVRLEAVETPGPHPPEGAVFYRGLHVGSGDDSGPSRSADGGSTWRAGRARAYPFTVYSLATGPAGIVIPGAQEEGEDGEGTGAMEISADGVNWRLTAFPHLPVLNAAVYGHGKWVAVGDAGAVLTSADGAAWAEHTIPGGRDLLGVAAAEKGFVACGKEGSVFTSADGAVWTLRKTPDTWPWPAGLTAAGSTVACVGVYEDMWWSADSGVTWEARPHGLPDFHPRYLTHGEGLWVASESRFREESSTYDWRLAVSRDGREWSLLPARTAPVWISWLTIQDGRLWLFAQGEKPLRSALLPAGNTPPALTVPWPAVLTPRAETALTAAAGDAEGDAVSVLWERSGEEGYRFGPDFRGEILIGGARTLTARASDGRGGHASAERTYFVEDPLLEWKDITSQTWDGTGEWSAARSPARALLLRDREAGSAPLDGMTDPGSWTKVSLPWRGAAVVWGPAGFVAVGQAYVPEPGVWRPVSSRSADGLTWGAPRTLPGTEVHGVASAGNVYIAVGAGGMIARSTDGETWTAIPSGVTGSLLSVAFTGARGLAAGGRLLQSADSGLTWTDITPMAGGGEITGVMAARDLLFVSASGSLRVHTPATGAWADANVDTARFGEVRSLVFHDGVFLALSQKRDPATLSPRSFLLVSRDGLTWEGTEMPGGGEARTLLASGSTLLAVGPGGLFANGPAARFRLLTWGPGRTSGQWDLTVASTPGHRCQAQESADLLTWTPLGEEVTAAAGETTLTVPAPAAGGGMRYFRVSMREP